MFRDLMGDDRSKTIKSSLESVTSITLATSSSGAGYEEVTSSPKAR